MNRLRIAKNLLGEQAFEVYRAMAEDRIDDQAEYENLFADLGEMMYEIESCQSLAELIEKISKGNFSQIGLADDEDLVDFLGRFAKQCESVANHSK